MTRFYQNVLYIGILVIIIGFFWIIIPKYFSLPKGIYLPQNIETFVPVNEESVAFYSADIIDQSTSVPRIADLYNKPIGIVRVDIHYHTNDQILTSCQKNITEAKRLAALYGATKIVGNCLVSKNNHPIFSDAHLYAYAYR